MLGDPIAHAHEVAACDAPLSFNQSSYLVLEWLAQLRTARRGAVPITLGLSLDGSLNVTALERALNRIVDRHAVLRTAFPDPRRLTAGVERSLIARLHGHDVSGAGVFVQDVRPAAALDLVVEPVRASGPSEELSYLHGRIREEIERPFDYGRPPLMRATLLAMAPARHLLIVLLHHLVADRWSADVLRNEVELLYDEHVAGRSRTALPPLPLQYTDFADQQRRRFGTISDAVTARCSRHWATYGAARLKPSDLPARPDAAASGSAVESGYQSLALDADVVFRLRTLARQQRITMYMLCLAAMAIVFHAYTRKTVLAWWIYSSNRSRREFENLIGWFAHGQLFGITLSPDEPATALLARAGEQVLDMHQHQDVPIQVLWNILLTRGVEAEQLFDDQFVSYDFVIPREPDRTTLSDGVVVGPAPRALMTTGNWPSLGLFSMERPSTLTLDCRYKRTQCDAAGIAALLQDFQAVLRHLAASPRHAVSRIAAGLTPG